MTDNTLDLDAERAARAEARAARHEGRDDEMTIRLGGKPIAVVAAEFPMSVLEPLMGVNVDVAYLVRAFSQILGKKGGDADQAAIGLLFDVLAANPRLPHEIVEAIKEMTRRVLTPEGYDALCELNPTPWDGAALAKGLMAWWGVSLGESQASLPPSEGGETSKATSNGTTSSTPAASGKSRARKGSSGSAGS